MCFNLFTVTSIHRIQKSIKKRQKLGKKWKEAEDTGLKREKNQVDKQKCLRKKKSEEDVFKRRNWLMHVVNTVLDKASEVINH